MACYEWLLLSKAARSAVPSCAGSANKGRFLKHLQSGPDHPTLLLSNPAIRRSPSYNFFPRRTHHHYTQPKQQHFRSLATMAANKEFTLLCLENPLLGKFDLVVLPLILRSIWLSVGDGE